MKFVRKHKTKLTLRSDLSAIMELNSGKSFRDKATVCNNLSSATKERIFHN